MKDRIFNWTLGMLLGVLPLAGGCAQEPSGADTNTASVVPVSTGTPPAIPLAESADPAEPADPADTNLLQLAEAEVTPVSDEKPIPANLNLGAPALEIVKLTHSGVDEGVMMTYVTNSASTYNLNADQIIYMKDIGVPAGVVSAMLQHDQAIKSGLAVNPIPVPGAPEPAAETAATPAPEEVAPQAEAAPAPAPAPAAAPEPSVNVTYSTFYDSLSPYGTWVYVEGYGRCWQPTVVAINPGWRPYYDGGRWLYTDNGWYWYSDYSWGWAPFHYGRWFRHHRVGWCWAPDLFWGPSWVTFRYTSGYCGWAPLPPYAHYRPGFGFSYYGSSVAMNFHWGLGYDCFAFVPVHHFRSHNLHPYGVHHNHSHARTIYNQATVVNNVVIKNNTIINNGIPANYIARQTGTKVTKVAVKPQTGVGAPAGRGEKLSPRGNTLTVYRPEPAKNQAQRPVNRVAQRPAPTQKVAAVPATLADPRSARPAPGAAQPARGSMTQIGGGGRPGAPVGVSPTVPAVTATRPQARPSLPNPALEAPKAAQPQNRLNARPQVQTPSQRQPQPATGTTPLILRGSQGRPAATPATPSRAPTQTAPRSQPAPGPTTPATRPQTPTRGSAPNAVVGQNWPAAQAPQAAPQRTWSTPQTAIQSGNRLAQRTQTIPSTPSPAIQQAPRAIPPTPSFTPPSRTTPSYTPAPVQRSEPSFSAPQRQQSFSAPQRQQSFSMPAARPTPSPSFSAPAARPTPSYSAPAPSVQRSAPSPAPSSGGSSGNRMNDRGGGGRR